MIFQVIKIIKSQKLNNIDDFASSLNRNYTVCLLIIAFMVLNANKYFNGEVICLDESIKTSPISIKYVQAVCSFKQVYVYNTLDFENSLENEKSYKIGFNFWYIYFLVLITLTTTVPYLIWRSYLKFYYLNDVIDINKIVAEYEKKNCVDSWTIFQIDNSLKKNNKNSLAKNTGIKLLIMIILIKILYFLNACLVVISIFNILDLNFLTLSNFILSLLKSSSLNINSTFSRYFPSIFLCDVHVRSSGVHKTFSYQFQCTLPLNILAEKIYIFLLLWFIFLIFYNFIEIIRFIINFFLRYKLIKEQINDENISQNQLKLFVDNYLNIDGFIFISIIKSNIGFYKTSKILKSIWNRYKFQI